MGYSPPPPPPKPLNGNTETVHLSYCREMYVGGHVNLAALETMVERVLRGDYPLKRLPYHDT